jgi:6-phosphogluconolactonase (cycloisomerase 2 family)
MPACRLPPQPEIAAFSKDSSTGGSSLIPSSPTLDQLEGGSMAVDALGRFLFVPDPATSKISMFQIDRNTGALNEVPASPLSIATEASGQFLYVGYAFGNFVGQSSVNAFLIDSTNLQLLPLPVQSTTDIDSPPIGLFADPKGRYLYAGSGANLVHEYSERHNERLQD